MVLASPERVAAHDRAGWLALFADGAVVEDPVGSQPARKGAGVRRGTCELGRFYDTFIAPNDIRFEIAADIVAPPFAVRDVVIETCMPSGFRLRVPAYLLYEVVPVGGALRILRLSAHWELVDVSRQALAGGPGGWGAVLGNTARIARIQRLSGLRGYARASVRGAGGRGRRAVAQLGHPDGPPTAPGARAMLPDGRSVPVAEVARALGPLVVSEARSAGWTTAFRFATPDRSGIGFAHFHPGSARITRAWFFA